MHFPSAMLAGVTALSFFQATQGYLIDPDSCKGDKYDFVKDTVEQAFRMAELASSKADPLDDNAKFLMQQLFNLDGAAATTAIKRTFDKSTPNNKGDRTGILTFKDEKKGDLDDLDQNEVVIFCDTSRLKRRLKDPLHYYDTKAKQATGVTDGCGRAFMYTQTWGRHWSAIQVCPWFLDYAVAKKYHTSVDIRSLKGFLAAKGLDQVITDHKYTPIDLMTLWDKTMLHEMMHTTPGGLKDDVGGFGGYGWKNCKGMAHDKGINNADSWALFGSALYWFNQGSPIDENGDFTSPAMQQQQPPPARRWLGSGPAMGAGMSKVDALKQFL